MHWPCFHRWGKWSDPLNGIAAKTTSDYGYFKVLQMRVCDKCGIAVVRDVGEMRSINELNKRK